MSKRCSKCKENKVLSEFGTYKIARAKGDKTYVKSRCKRCQKERERAWREANREKHNQRVRESRARKKAGIKRKSRRTHEENMAKKKAYMKKRKKEDPNYKLRDNLSCRLRMALKHNLKSARTFELLGTTVEHLVQHLEAQFLPGMNWQNHGRGEGKWQIDHIMPCASFNLIDADQQRQCFHYTNLQPLWYKDNSEKSAKVPTNRRWVDCTTGWIYSTLPISIY